MSRRFVVPLIVGVAVVSTLAAIPVIDAKPRDNATTTTTTAQVTTPGVTADTIRVGVLHTAVVGYESYIVSVAAGHGAYWDSANRSGGVDGRRVEVDTAVGLDSASARGAAYADATTSDALVSSTVGTFLVLGDAPPGGPVLVADSPMPPWVLNDSIVLDGGHTSYSAEIAAGTSWAFSGEGLGLAPTTPVALLYQDDGYGSECRDGLDYAGSRLSLGAMTETGFAPDALDVTDQIAEIAQAGPGLVIVCATPQQLLQVIGVGVGTAMDVPVLVTSASYSPDLPFVLAGGVDRSDPAMEATGLALLGNVWVLSSVPAFEEPEMAPLRNAIPPDQLATVDSGFLLGWAQAATAHAILAEASRRGDLSRDGILAVLDDGVEVDSGWSTGRVGLRLADRTPRLPLYVLQPASLSENQLGLEAASPALANPYSG